MGIESGRSPGVPDRNVETSATGGCSDGKALSHSSCRGTVHLEERSGTQSATDLLYGSRRREPHTSTIQWCDGVVRLIDQRRLPEELVFFDGDRR